MSFSPKSNATNIYADLKKASKNLFSFSEKNRQDALHLIANELDNRCDEILKENKKDMEAAQKNNVSSVLMDRLYLDKKRIALMSKACREIALQETVLGFEEHELVRPSGIRMRKQRIPIGMMAMVFESRPNVIIDAMALCIKSANGLILKGGKEAFFSNQYLFHLASSAFFQKIPCSVFHYIDSREEFHHLLKQEQYVDLVIARGGSALVEYVKKEAAMPVMSHDKGLCHIYIHYDANQTWVNQIVLNAKISRPSVCNALESLLIHEDYQHKETLIKELLAAHVELRGCPKAVTLDQAIHAACEKDYDTEYLDKILSIKIVKSNSEAIEHIQKHSSHHTEGIIASDSKVIDHFVKSIDASCIAVNSSTRFNDGGELALGAELGISTSKFHAYGPVGAKQMTTLRYVISSEGCVRS